MRPAGDFSRGTFFIYYDDRAVKSKATREAVCVEQSASHNARERAACSIMWTKVRIFGTTSVAIWPHGQLRHE